MTTIFVHPRGLCETTNVGAGTRVWAFSHVLPGARVGRDVNINDHVFIENDVWVGDRVTIKSGVQLWDGIRLEDDVFVGPNVTFTNDRFPRSKVYPDRFAQTVVRRGASIGGGATILPGISIGSHAMVGAGSVVTRDVPPFAIVRGNPARISGYVDSEWSRTPSSPQTESSTDVSDLLLPITLVTDLRGTLAAIEFCDLPFAPQRVFTVSNVPSMEVRGEHAHRRCEQVLVCMQGSVSVLLDDGTTRRNFRLDSAAIGLHMKAMTWGSQYHYTADALLAVFASLPYDENDYIRSYEDFLLEVAGKERDRE